MSKVVLISGKQGSGKTTLARALKSGWMQKPGHMAVEVNFADPLKQMADAVANVGERYGLTPMRPKDGLLLQILGTEWGRVRHGENVWVDCAKKAIHDIGVRLAHYPHLLFIVADCRFHNEFNEFPDALRVRLNCGEAIRKQRCEQWRDNTDHPSEIGLDDYEAMGKFDVYLGTGGTPLSDCVETVLSYLQLDWNSMRLK